MSFTGSRWFPHGGPVTAALDSGAYPRGIGDDFDDVYFQSYAHVGVHELMIKDAVRTEAYRDAILMNSHAIKDKVVVDVGCGTGILSMFAAQAGARRVYAIEASPIAQHAEEVVKANGFADIIKIVRGKAEEVEIGEPVDVLISEWMGYLLLYESMLRSVIFARDKFLRPGGLMLPSVAKIYMAPVSNEELYDESIDFWKDVYGFNMSAVGDAAKLSHFRDPVVEIMPPQNVLSWPVLVKELNCSSISVLDAENFEAEFSTTSMMMRPLHGFVFWFEVEFPSGQNLGHVNGGGGKIDGGQDKTKKRLLANPRSLEGTKRKKGAEVSRKGEDGHGLSSLHTLCEEPDPEAVDGEDNDDAAEEEIILSTGPEKEPTHWQQTVLYLDTPVGLQQDSNIEGRIRIKCSEENKRFLDISLIFSVDGGQSTMKSFTMR